MIRVVFNRKGGVGKSSITCNLAAVSASQGHRTLLVDLDAQANATSYLGHDGKDDVAGIAEFYESQLSYRYRDFAPKDFVRSTVFSNLFLISADAELNDLAQKLESRHKIYKLREFLQTLAEDFDQIFIDTPPALNFYSLSALIAADRCLIPFDCDAFSRDALLDLLHALEEIREDHNDKLEIEGIVINQFLARARLPQAAVDELKSTNLKILQPYLSSSVKMKESHASQQPLVYLAPKHKLSAEFVELFNALNAQA
ncbi:MAG: ParA family protein [Gammaproteobacteria bacterium]|nr:ParA family protein [Gammaproteobacteria bacterium]MBL6999484.1 ParA family protein [Gammaproteobacteria bacterium]